MRQLLALFFRLAKNYFGGDVNPGKQNDCLSAAKESHSGLALSALALAAPAGAAESGKCNNETWNGTYGFTLTGWRIPAPLASSEHLARAGVGRLVADGKGNLSGSETKSKNGLIVPVTFTGTYTVYADCTGIATLTATDAGDEQIRTFSFVIVDSGGQVMAIQTDEGRAVTVIATRERGK